MDDNPTEVRGNRAASVLEHSHPATDFPEGVVHGIADVEPEELAAVVVRIIVERSTGDVRADLLNRFLIHIRVEDVCGLVRRGVVGGIGLPLVSRGRAGLHEGINLGVGSAAVSEAGNFQIVHVVEPTEGTLDTERGDKLARGGIADVLTEFAVVAEELAARLRARNESEDGGAILLAESVVSSTITDEADAKLVKLILRQLEGRGGNIVEVGVFGVVSSLHLGDEAEILRAAAVVENRLGKLGKLFDSLGNLGLNLERGLQIIQADARGLIGNALEVPATDSLTEGQIRRSGDATRGGGSRRGSDIRPVVFKRARKDTLDGDLVQSGAHSLREFANANESAPRAFDGVTLMHVNGETVRFPLEQIVNCGASNSHSVR